MEITYTNAGGDQVVQAQALLRDRASSFAFYHYFWVVYWGAMAALGVYVSLFVGQIFVACIFVSMFLLYAVAALPYSRVWHQWARQVSRGTSRKHICLRLDERGLHEPVEGAVESFAPWSAVRSFAVFDGHLLIELAGDLWANVPRATVVEGDAAFEEVVQTLRARGVAEQRSNQAIQRTAGRSDV